MSKSTALASLAQQLNIDAAEAQSLVINTLMKAKNGQQPTNEELVTFLAIASEYRLNPLTKEIYAFSNRGAIQPIVSIDGWLKIINQHPQFDGMEFVDSMGEDGALASVTCKIYRKDRSRPTEVTEYMSECKGKSEPWAKWPARMLRHKATIQAARYAFGLSGFVDPDEADRIEEATEKNMGAAQVVKSTEEMAQALPGYSDEEFQDMIPQWREYIHEKGVSASHMLNNLSTRRSFTESQVEAIKTIESEQEVMA